jgi:hypothetical protein
VRVVRVAQMLGPIRFQVRSVFCTALLCLSSGCAVDDRELHLADAVGNSRGGSSSLGNAGDSGSSASGGRPAGLDAPDPPACDYAGTEVADGCQTLVSNPGFDQQMGVTDWPGANLAIVTQWNELDADGNTASGSLYVANHLSAEEQGETINGALQCIPATPGAVYDVVTDVYIPKQETQGRAGVTVFFYRPTDCNASLVGTDQSYTTDLIDVPEVWTRVAGRFVVPPNMHSMEVVLVAGKPFKPLSFAAQFDNVLVQAK